MSEHEGREQPPAESAGVPPELEWVLTPRSSEDQTPIEDFKNALRAHWRSVLEGPVTDEALTFAQARLREARDVAKAKGVDVGLVETEFEKEIISQDDEGDQA